MTRFRFQLISVSTVFVALAVGLAVGTVEVRRQAPASDTTQADAVARRDQADAVARGNQADAVARRNKELLGQVGQLDADLAAREKFAESLAPVVLAGRLTGAKVLILSTVDARSDVDGVVAMLTVAGATVAGKVELTDTFTDPANAQDLLDLANRSLPPSLTTGLPSGVDGVSTSAALLAGALVAHTPPPTDVDIRSVLSAFASKGYLNQASAVTVPADAVVLVAGPPAGGGDSGRRNMAVYEVVTQFDKAGAIVVADRTDSGPGNIVALVRGDPALSTTVSTVDDVATPQGRLVTAWALADQLAGRTGHYGTGIGAQQVPAGTG